MSTPAAIYEAAISLVRVSGGPLNHPKWVKQFPKILIYFAFIAVSVCIGHTGATHADRKHLRAGSRCVAG
jgi:hypothetical protein